MALFDNAVGNPELKELANKMAAHILEVASAGDPDVLSELCSVLAGLSNMASGISEVLEAMNPKLKFNEDLEAMQGMLQSIILPKTHSIHVHHVHEPPADEANDDEGGMN